MVDMAFFRGGLGRWLPPSVPPVDEAVLLRRCWELLVLDRPGTARLAVLGRAPLCRTVLLPQENTDAPLRAQQVVVPVLAVGLCYEVESDVLRMLVYYILSLMSVNSPADSVLRAAFCHYPENYITLMEYYDPAEHGMEAYTRK